MLFALCLLRPRRGISENPPDCFFSWRCHYGNGPHEAFRQGLRELGYVEGENVVVESRSAEGKLDRLPALAAELVRLKVDVIVTGGSEATRAAKEATVTTPSS